MPSTWYRTHALCIQYHSMDWITYLPINCVLFIIEWRKKLSNIHIMYAESIICRDKRVWTPRSNHALNKCYLEFFNTHVSKYDKIWWQLNLRSYCWRSNCYIYMYIYVGRIWTFPRLSDVNPHQNAECQMSHIYHKASDMHRIMINCFHTSNFR